MASLKELRNRQKSIEATKKITSAMKMIAAAKLKKAADVAAASRPYGDLMADMVYGLVSNIQNQGGGSSLPLIVGTGPVRTHLILVLTSNRGLCGGFNTSVVRIVKQLILKDKSDGVGVQFICIGHRGRDQLRRDYGSLILDTMNSSAAPQFFEAAILSDKIMALFESGRFQRCTLVFNRFISALSQEVTAEQLIPLMTRDNGVGACLDSNYEYEPSQTRVLDGLLPRHIRFQIFRAMLESAASEQGARMAAMDGATRNAGDMIRALDLKYNRTRQAQITKELIEIISGAEAL